MEWIRINKKDNVAVAITDIEKNQLIKKGHKFALRDIAKGEKVIKYGAPIGIATKDIAEGDWVHVHNVRTLLDTGGGYTYEKVCEKTVEREKESRRTFFGYRTESRSDRRRLFGKADGLIP